MAKLCNRLKKIDFFGEQVVLTFQQDSRFRSWPGTFFSCAVLNLFLVFFIIRTIKIVSLDDPFLSMTHMGVEGTPIDLKKLQYFFAIENIDPRIGRVKVS